MNAGASLGDACDLPPFCHESWAVQIKESGPAFEITQRLVLGWISVPQDMAVIRGMKDLP